MRSSSADWLARSHLSRAAVVTTVGILLVCLATVVLSVQSHRTGDRTARTATQASAIADTSNRVLLDLINAETGQRGYLLTSDTSYLEPYLAAMQDLPVRLRRFQGLADGIPGATAQSSLIATLADRKRGELAETVALYRRGNRSRRWPWCERTPARTRWTRLASPGPG